MASFNRTATKLGIIIPALLMMVGCTITDGTNDGSNWVLPDEPTASGEQAPPTGAILWEFYNGYPDGLIEDVRAATTFFDVAPSRTYLMTALDMPKNVYDNFTIRLRGYLRPAISGDYRIYIRGTVAGGIWLSTDDQPANARLVAKFDQTTPSGVWDGLAGQKSDPIYLESGKSYYLEAIQKNATGSDFFIIGWAAANAPASDVKVIRGNELAPYFETSGADPAVVAESYVVGYRVGYTDGRYGFPVDATHPMKDSDGDGLPDNWETAHGMDPNNDADALADTDGDGLYALLEFQSLSDPRKLDSDADGIPDGWEVNNGLSPLDAADALLLNTAGISYLQQYRSDLGLPPPLKRGEVLIKWSAPTVREDGSELLPTEISGFEILYGPSEDTMTKTLRVEQGEASWVILPGLEPGFVLVSVRAYDNQGRMSSPSDTVRYAVAE